VCCSRRGREEEERGDAYTLLAARPPVSTDLFNDLARFPHVLAFETNEFWPMMDEGIDSG
jgi:hypothetical protein